MLGAIPQVQLVFLLRSEGRHLHAYEFCHQWGDGYRQGYLRSWILLDLHLRTHSLLQARAHLSITRHNQMRAPLTRYRVSLHSNHPWPWHCISWWGWGACTRCPSPSRLHLSIWACLHCPYKKYATICSIFDSRMRLCIYLWWFWLELLSAEFHQIDCGSHMLLSHL